MERGKLEETVRLMTKVAYEYFKVADVVECTA